MKDNLYIDNEARGGIIRGIQRVADAVGRTMGTGGSNSIIEAIENPGYLMTNDGYTILNSITFEDPLQELGRKILVESVSKSNKQSGDGSSTACVLTAAIIEEGMRHLNMATAMEIKRSLEECVPEIEAIIKGNTKVISPDDVESVATISAEDVTIGRRIAEIYKTIGKDGLIFWDVSRDGKDRHEIGKGITIEDCGWASPYMCDADSAGRNTMKIRVTKPPILISRQKITSANQLANIAGWLSREGTKDLVVFCEDYDPLVLNDLTLTRAGRGFRVILVKMPIIFKDEWYEDLADASKATIVDPALGLKLEQVTKDHLGSFGEIDINKDSVHIDGICDMTAKVERLKSENTDEANVRAARLSQTTARYFVGAQTEAALAYRRLKVEDAIAAAYHALRGGVVAGGGVALRDVTEGMSMETVGARILDEALRAPYERILKNVGIDSNKMPEVAGVGIDTRTLLTANMLDVGIVDPADIVLNAVRNSISVAASVLTAQSIVLLPRDLYQPSGQPAYAPAMV